MPLTYTARETPNGTRMDDGFSTLFAFQADPDIAIWEKTVKPPGLDGGDAIETSTMHNEEFRTFAARQLKTLTDAGSTMAYDPAALEQLLALINVETAITLHFPNGAAWVFYGYLRVFDVQDHEEGSQPEASVQITPTNVDPTTRVEVAPIYLAPGETGTS